MSAPGVVTEPMVLIEEAPEPKVLVVDAPVAKVEEPTEVIGPLVVIKPVPKVTGLLVTVLIESVVAVVRSMIGLEEEIFVLTLFKVTVPVPVLNVFVPVTVVAPFKEIAPVPVLNMLAPV